MQTLIRILALLFVALSSSPSIAALKDAEQLGCPVPDGYHSAAFQESMVFFQGWNRGNSIQSQWLVGVGVIDETTPSKFASFLSGIESRRQRLVLHSPGGNLLAGLQLGLQIREAGLATQVGRTHKFDMEKDYPCRTLEGDIESGECSSACAYAFLGGVARELSSDFHRTPQSRLGFHQFYGDHDVDLFKYLDPSEVASQTMISTQLVVGYVAAYLANLDMNLGILQLALQTMPDEMTYPDQQVLTDLGVITPSVFQRWFIEPYREGMVAASRESSPITPAQQLTAYCRSPTGEAVLMMTSDFGLQDDRAQSNDDKASKYSGFLKIDGTRHEIKSVNIDISSTVDLVFVRMTLSPRQAIELSSAKEFEMLYDVPHFMGFQFGRAILSEIDRKSIALAFRNCV